MRDWRASDSIDIGLSRSFRNSFRLHRLRNIKNKMENLDDDDVKLPADTLAILSQFMKEQEAQGKEDLFAENWNLSQFW